jgi:hypothetical protein
LFEISTFVGLELVEEMISFQRTTQFAKAFSGFLCQLASYYSKNVGSQILIGKN